MEHIGKEPVYVGFLYGKAERNRMIKTSKKKIMFFLIGLYTILPDYTKIFGQNSALICACAIFICFYLLKFHKNFKIRKTEVQFLLVYLMFACAVHIIHGEIDQVIRTIFEKCFLVLLIERTLQDRKDVDKLVDVIILFSIFEIAAGIFHFFSNINVFSFIQSSNLSSSMLKTTTQYRNGMVRIEGSFGHPITFGIYLSICACLSLYRYNGTKKKKYVVFYLLQFFALLLTISRFPILVFFASQFIYLLSLNPRKVIRITIRVALCVGFCIFIAYAFAPKLFKIVSDIVHIVSNVFSSNSISGIRIYSEGSESAFGYRAEMIRVLSSIIKEHPLFGIGETGYLDKNFYFMIGNYRHTSIDNEYYVQLVIYGVVGFVSLLWWLFGLHFFDKRKKKSNNGSITSIRFYRFLILFIYSLNLLSVAMMFEYKLIIVLYSIFIFDIIYNRSNEIKKQDYCEESMVYKTINETYEY